MINVRAENKEPNLSFREYGGFAIFITNAYSFTTEQIFPNNIYAYLLLSHQTLPPKR